MTEIFAFLPRLLGAGLFFFAGLILARIVRHLVEAALIAANLDGLLAAPASARPRHRGRRPPTRSRRATAPGTPLDRQRGRRDVSR